MDFMTLAQKRCSVRSYRPEPVEQEKLDTILEAESLRPPQTGSRAHSGDPSEAG
jgi:nitroreductase